MQWGHDADGTLEWVWRYGRVFSRAWVNVHLIGSEHLPPTGPVIVAGNHRSHADIPAVVGALDRRIVFAATDDLWRSSRVLDFVLTSQRCPRVNRAGVDRRALDDCLAMLGIGRVLGIFPEGGLSPDGLGPFEAGAAFLAQRSGAPLVPFGLAGTRDAWQHRTWWPIRSRQVVMVIGPPLQADPELHRRAATRDLNDRLRDAVAHCVATAERIRARVIDPT